MSHEFFIHTPIGSLKLVASELGVQRLEFVESAEHTPDPSATRAPLVRNLQQQMNEYFEGKRTEFDIPVDLQGTDFQIEVWNLLQTIPYGKTLSYAQLSEKYGEPNAIRAIASANARNKIAILIPCHRIIGSNGDLTGYAWGLQRKRHLLELEGGLPKQAQLPFN